MRLIRDQNRFVFIATYDERHIPKQAGFSWDKNLRVWWTTNARAALKLAGYADDALRRELLTAAESIPDPDRCTLVLEGTVFRYFSPVALNDHAKKAGFRWAKVPVFYWWTEDLSAAVKCYQSASSEPTFVCDPETAKILRDEQGRRIGAIKASRAADADIDIPCPPGCTPLPYQRAAVAYARDRDVVLFGDQMRLGKTVEAILWTNCQVNVRRGLIIPPATIKLNWLREWKKWSTLGLTVGVANGLSNWPDTDIVIANAEILTRTKDAMTVPVLLKSGKPKMKKTKNGYVPATKRVYPLRKEIRETPWDFVIVDEGHRFKGGEKTARGQCLLQLQPTKRAALTGTPIPNRPIEIWPILNWLDPLSFPEKDYFKFALRYAGATRGAFGWDLSGASHLDELQNLLREKFMIRRLRSQVFKELPPKRRQLIEFPCPDNRYINEQDALWKRYTNISSDVRQAVDASEVLADAEEHKERVRALTSDRMACFEEIARIRHEDAVNRIPFIVAHVKELLEEEPKVICFAWHNDVVEAIAGEFPGCVVIYGKTPQNQRVALQDRFQNDKSASLCVISIAVCEGLDLSAASLGVMAEHDWVPKNIAQAEDRMENPFKKDSSLIQYCVFQGSLDARMAQMLVYKEEIGYDALDRDTTKLAELVAVSPSGGQVELPEKEEASGPDSLPIVSPTDRIVSLNSQNVPSNGASVPQLSENDCRLIHDCVRQLAEVCDGAFSKDGAGFSAFDTRFGHSLAAAQRLTPTAAQAALGLLRKYRSQLGGRLEKYYG